MQPVVFAGTLVNDIPLNAPSRAGEIDDLTRTRAVRGDARACRTLVERYQHRVFALIGRMLRPHGLDAAIEDVAQETFLRVFAHLGRFRPDGRARLSTWILTIATRLCIDRLRRRRPQTSLDAVPQSALRGGPSADRAPVGAGLERAIAALPPDWQAVFVLRVGHDLDYAEIAEVLDIPLGTVRSRLSRARAQLRAALRAEGGRP